MTPSAQIPLSKRPHGPPQEPTTMLMVTPINYAVCADSAFYSISTARVGVVHVGAFTPNEPLKASRVEGGARPWYITLHALRPPTLHAARHDVAR
jgi:hypothetical protein